MNFRDLGGLSSADGRFVRSGLLFRCGEFAATDAHERACIRRSRLRTVYDLRSAAEREQAPAPAALLAGVEVILTDASAAILPSRDELTRDGRFTQGSADRIMHDLYARMPGAFASVLADLFERLLGGAAPLLIHCSAGKDRTGFVVALLLAALDVRPDEIDADYLVSARAGAGEFAHTDLARYLETIVGHTVDRQALQPMLTVAPSYLAAAREQIDVAFGGLHAYLRDACGMDAARCAALRQLFTEAVSG